MPKMNQRDQPGIGLDLGCCPSLPQAAKRHMVGRHYTVVILSTAGTMRLDIHFTYPDCVACCITVATSCVKTRVGGYSPYIFQYA